MKTILAIINNPKKSKQFISYVAKLSVDLQYQVHLLYVQDPGSYPLGSPSTSAMASVPMGGILENESEQAKLVFAKLINEISKEISDELLIDFSIKIGNAEQIASAFVENKKADMLVLEGGDNESFWLHAISNMDLIENMNCPVWIIPSGISYKPMEKIIYATDYNEEDISTIKETIYLTRNFLPEIVAVHITNSVDFEEKINKAGFLDMVRKATAYNNLFVRAIRASEKMEMTEMLTEYATAIKANLIVVLKENRNFLQKLFKPDQTKKIIKSSNVPVLVYHKHNQ